MISAHKRGSLQRTNLQWHEDLKTEDNYSRTCRARKGQKYEVEDNKRDQNRSNSKKQKRHKGYFSSFCYKNEEKQEKDSPQIHNEIKKTDAGQWVTMSEWEQWCKFNLTFNKHLGKVEVLWEVTLQSTDFTVRLKKQWLLPCELGHLVSSSYLTWEGDLKCNLYFQSFILWAAGIEIR